MTKSTDSKNLVYFIPFRSHHLPSYVMRSFVLNVLVFVVLGFRYRCKPTLSTNLTPESTSSCSGVSCEQRLDHCVDRADSQANDNVWF